MEVKRTYFHQDKEAQEQQLVQHLEKQCSLGRNGISELYFEVFDLFT